MTERFFILGIDPGVEGALAFIDPVACTLRVEDMPTYTLTKQKTKRYVDAVLLGGFLRHRNIAHAFVEDVHASPQMGVVSAFSFGEGYGAVKGALAALAVPLDKVPPAEWKKQMRAPRDKKESRARALELMPSCAAMLKRPDRAEAAMIAMFGCFRLGHLITKPLTPGE